MVVVDIRNNPCDKKEIFDLLKQLTEAPEITHEKYNDIVSSLNDNHNIFTFVDNGKTVGLITLFIEQKLIHGGKCVAHIEDLVVDREYRRKGISSALIGHVMQYINNKNCYKVILNCKEELEPVYENSGFQKKGIQMGCYLPIPKTLPIPILPGKGWAHKDCACKSCVGDAYFIM